MQTNKILSASLIDLIFDGRNKEYGAYDLRSTYSRRIKKALVITISFMGLVFGGAVLANSFKKEDARYSIIPGVELTEIPAEKQPEKLPEPEQQKAPEQVKTVRLTPPEIVPDEDFKQPPPSQIEIADAKIGTDPFEGIPDDGIDKPDGIDDGKGIITQKTTTVSDEPFTDVQIDAKFNGNWKAFLERNLNAEVPAENSAPAGRYSIVVQFVVDVEGNVSDIKTLTNHGYGMEAEAIRVLKKAAKWEPAIQNGIKVKAYRKQVIVFEVIGEE